MRQECKAETYSFEFEGRCTQAAFPLSRFCLRHTIDKITEKIVDAAS